MEFYVEEAGTMIGGVKLTPDALRREIWRLATEADDPNRDPGDAWRDLGRIVAHHADIITTALDRLPTSARTTEQTSYGPGQPPPSPT